ISRKEGKLFVRKGFEPVFDTPVTFEDPNRPLGTHVFTALAVNDDNTTLRWNVVSMPGAGSPPVKKSVKGKRVEAPAAPVVGPPSNAKEALDRVTIPPDALERISELRSPGASLITRDKGLGGGTGKGTDFIVLRRCPSAQTSRPMPGLCRACAFRPISSLPGAGCARALRAPPPW